MAEEGTDNAVIASENCEDTAEKSSVGEEAATRDSTTDVSMDLETPENASKRPREEDPQEDNDNGDGPSKKQKTEEPDGSQQDGAEKSVEEARLDVTDAQEGDGGKDGESCKAEGKEEEVEGDEQIEGDGGKVKEEKVGPVKLGPKVFDTSKEMFDYFYKFLHYWPLNLNVNKYEHMALQELLIQGHHESDKKVGPGIEAFQIRVHPEFQSRCFVLIRKDDTIDDFSYRKCVDSLLPLPENMKTSGKNLGSFDQKNSNKSKQGRGGWGGGRGGGGRGGRHGGNHGRHGGRGRGRGTC
ncbi:hypothetical protein SUGI_1099420 [Cryptomeria japonica]|uniref:protein EMBRYO DEFECTIVE 514 isoform X2 n=1 Tax=Cryptomeria japonica TaxID=3369 RepID=UPI0024148871|nr:protein EMBRYO DEFECTIVE 514 isoform X2 [Cryptomeria japonica]GLJ51733.1 hypothetical protein SUGI_1099420 [Cryptomeria japonica]